MTKKESISLEQLQAEKAILEKLDFVTSFVHALGLQYEPCEDYKKMIRHLEVTKEFWQKRIADFDQALSVD